MTVTTMEYAVADESLKELYETAKKLKPTDAIAIILFIELYEIDPNCVPAILANYVNDFVSR